VSPRDNSKSYGRIFLKFCGYVEHGTNYKWLNFGGDPAGILDSGSLWNFRYHCVKGGIREPLQNQRWWRHLANSIALAEVPASYDCFLVLYLFLCQITPFVSRTVGLLLAYRLKTHHGRISHHRVDCWRTQAESDREKVCRAEYHLLSLCYRTNFRSVARSISCVR